MRKRSFKWIIRIIGSKRRHFRREKNEQQTASETRVSWPETYTRNSYANSEQDATTWNERRQDTPTATRVRRSRTHNRYSGTAFNTFESFKLWQSVCIFVFHSRCHQSTRIAVCPYVQWRFTSSPPLSLPRSYFTASQERQKQRKSNEENKPKKKKLFIKINNSIA